MNLRSPWLSILMLTSAKRRIGALAHIPLGITIVPPPFSESSFTLLLITLALCLPVSISSFPLIAPQSLYNTSSLFNWGTVTL